MRFEHLPDDWAQRPITDADVFEGVVDLIATERSRAEGATYLLLCHDNGRLLQPMCLPAEPATTDPDRGADRDADPGAQAPDARRGPARDFDERVGPLLAELVRQQVRHLALVIARPGSVEAGPGDRALRDAWARACERAGVTLRAAAVAGSDEVRALGPGGPAAA